MSAYDLTELRRELTGWRLVYRATLRSTNTFALQLRQSDRLVAPAIVLTGRQTAGRGRGRNVWFSTQGTITATFVLPLDERMPAWRVPLMAGLAVRRAAALFSREPVELKWPNDVMIGDRKLAGLLCERAENVDMIGVGLNVMTDFKRSPAAVRERAVSLAEVGPGSISLTKVLLHLAREVRGLLHGSELSDAGVTQEYDRHNLLVGRYVSVDRGPEEGTVGGICQGVDETGRLLLTDGETVHRVITGRVVAW